MSRRKGFPLGQVTATLSIVELVLRTGLDLGHSLEKHKNGNWGDVDQATADENDAALKNNSGPLQSVWTSSGRRLWIRTTADRKRTVVSLAHEDSDEPQQDQVNPPA